MENYCTVLHTPDGKITGLIYPDTFSSTQSLFQLLQYLEVKAPYFARYELVLLVPISFQMAVLLTHETNISKLVTMYPFMKLMISETFPNLIDGRKNLLLNKLCNRYEVWLANLGSGVKTNMIAVMEKMFEGIVLDKDFAEKNRYIPFFPLVICEVEKYSKVSIPGISTGMYQEIKLRNVESLI